MAEIIVSDEELKKMPFGENFYQNKLIESGIEPSWICKLPFGPMRMVDRAKYNFSKGAGKCGKGYLVAEKDISQNDWYFYSHFLGDPVMPGSLGIDGCFQCLGLVLIIMGFGGLARALAGSFEYNGQILTEVKKIVYRVEIIRILKNPVPTIIAEVGLFREGESEPVYRLKEAKLSFFHEGQLERSPHYRPNWEEIKKRAVKEIEQSRDYYLKNFGEEGF